MLAIVMLAIILQRNTRPFNTLAVALFAVLAFDPLAVLSAGSGCHSRGELNSLCCCRTLRQIRYFLEVIKSIGDLGGIIAVAIVLFSTGFPDLALGYFIAVPIISLLQCPCHCWRS